MPPLIAAPLAGAWIAFTNIVSGLNGFIDIYSPFTLGNLHK